MSLKVSYDEQSDVLYLAREGEEERVEEVYPGLNLELDAQGELIGIEILRVTKVLKGVLASLAHRALEG